MSGDMEMPDDGSEETTTIKVTPPKKGRTNGAQAPTDEAIKAFGAAMATGTRELNVFRKSGPKGPTHKYYRGRMIQTGFAKTKLPPDAINNLVQAIDDLAGGGIYRVFPDNPRPGETLDNIVIPGRPKPLDEAQQADDDADVEEGLAASEPLPRLDGQGGFVPPPGLGDGYPFPPSPPPTLVPPGCVWDPLQRRAVPVTPFHDPHSKEIEKENAELKRKLEMDPLLRKLEKFEEKIEQDRNRPVQPTESPFKSLIDMIQLQHAESERDRKHQLALEEKRNEREREERRAREDREREERKEKAEREERERKAQMERDREDRLEREKTARDLMSTLVKITVEGKGKSNPIDDVAKLIAVTRDVKDMNAPPAKSETAEITEAVTTGAKEVVTAIGEIVAKRNPGPAQESGGPSIPKDERLQMLDVLDYMTNLAKTGRVKPRDAFTAVCAFCSGRGYDVEKVIEGLKKFATREEISKLAQELKENSESALVPANLKPQLVEASNLLAQETHALWLLEVGTIARGGE